VKKRFYTSLAWKVILALIVTVITIYSIHTAIIHAFEEITENIDRLARPNARLIAVNSLFRDISHLNHSQQAEAASGSRSPSLAFVNESKAIYKRIDTLRLLFDGDTIQTARIDEIENKLILREGLFIDFLELQYTVNSNPDIREYISNISKQTRSDTNEARVVKKFETTTSTTVSVDTINNNHNQEEASGFFNRLFGGRSMSSVPGVVRSETQVNKEYRVIIDTIEVKRNDALMTWLENSVDSLQTNQLQQLARLQRQELELLNTNSSLIQEINNIISSVEQEEIAQFRKETRTAFDITGNTIKNLNYLAIGFIGLSVLLVLLIIIDISRSNKYRKELEKANNEARREAEAKQRFLSNMSHEIRTPLQSIYGYTELARLQPDMKVDIDTIYHSAGHLLNVVNEVLDYARVTSGRISLARISFNPLVEIKSVIKAMQPLAGKKKLDLVLDAHLDGSLSFSGDPFRLRQILYNLIGNAIKFTNKGEIRVVAKTEISDPKTLLILNVIDTGVGISPKELPKLFQEYTNSHSTNGFDNGTGLGLSIVKKLTEIQNGKIEVESSPDHGSCFTIQIPYEVVNGEPVNKETANNKNGKNYIFTTKTVLLADDDPTILNLSSAILNKFKIPHLTFTNGPDLLEFFYNNQDVFIFLDVHMPGMSGLDVCRKIRRFSGHNHDLKVYALTAQALPDERQSILNAGFDDMIVKPFKESDLLEALSQATEKLNGNSSPLKIDSLLKMTGDDKNQLRMILNTMIRESRNDLGQLKRSLDNNQHESLALLIHRMAGRVGQAGSDEYALSLRKLEMDLRNGTQLINLERQVNEAIRQGDFFIKEVKGYIDTMIVSN
jgi:signal transduction histidine kinase/DNA-binding response OmpR family regulator